MPRNVWNDTVSWQTGRLNNSTKYQLFALMTINPKKKNWNPWENSQQYALKLFWNAYTWHVLDDPIFYGQWTKLHDQSLNGPKHVPNDFLVWSPTFIIQVNTHNIVMWETLQNNADWDCFKILILQEILRHSKSISGGTLCIFGSHTFVPISWMCKKQTSVSHSSTESEINSLDPGLRMDGIPALDLWDLILAVLHGNTNQSKQVHGDLSTSLTRKKIPGKIDDLNNVDFVTWHHSKKRKQPHGVINDLDKVDLIPSNVQFSHQEAVLTTKQWSRCS